MPAPKPTGTDTEALETIVDTDKERAVLVTARAVAPSDEWYTKDEIADKERKSKEIWDGVEDENRQAVLVLTRDSLARLIEDPDVWVPTSVEPITGTRIDVFVSIHLAEVDEEVLRRRIETERMIADDTAGLLELEAELRPSDDDGDDDAGEAD